MTPRVLSLLLATLVAAPVLGATGVAHGAACSDGLLPGGVVGPGSFGCSVPNGNFETCTGCVPGAHGTPDGWTVLYGEDAGTAMWHVQDRYAGTASLQLDCTGPFYLRSEVFTVEAGDSFTLWKAKRAVVPTAPLTTPLVAPRAATLVTAGLDFLDADGNLVGRDYSSGDATEQWSEGGAPIEVPPTAVAAYAFVGCVGAGTALVDEIHILY